MYFEDLSPGEIYISPGRTVTETDVVLFAGLTGDYNEIHTNAELAKKRPFGGRIAHGLLVLTLARGLMFRAGAVGSREEETFLGIDEIAFQNPVMIGDTIHVRATVKELVDDKDQRGIVLLLCETVNQNGVVTHQSLFRTAVKKKRS